MSRMWWERPVLLGHRTIFPDRTLVEMVARCFAVVHVGGLRGLGPERGRAFERTFYSLCDGRGLKLTERAGAQSVGGQKSASGLAHEVDGATRRVSCLSHWELKHLSGEVPKNDFLIFNGKGLDFLYGSERMVAQTPIYRFLLSGSSMRHECRAYSALWGINVIEPGILPLALLCEAVARGVVTRLSRNELDVIAQRGRWACRDVQSVLRELSAWTGDATAPRFGQDAKICSAEILDVQEQLGSIAFDCLDEEFPDWLDELAEDTWRLVGGW